jgi:two-component sensor histidine kinase
MVAEDPNSEKKSKIAVEPGIAERAKRIAERYMPAYIIVDDQSEVLHFSGRTGRYIEPATGSANLNLLSLVHRDLRPDLRTSLLKAASEHAAVKTEKILMGLNGGRLGVTIIVEPLLIDPREPQAFVVFFQDTGITEDEEPSDNVNWERLQAKIEELESMNEELKSSNEDRQQLLLGELQHRVKNILAVVRSLANRTAERAEDLEDFTAHFDGRLSAMGRTQNIVTRTAEGSVDLAELVHDELVGHAAHYSDQVDVDGPEIKLRTKPAQTLSLAIHELTTNAVKYGALSTPSGHIRVSWRIVAAAGNPRLAFEWVETGVPVIDQEPARNGFGRELIERGLPYELNAHTALEFRQGGVRCVMELPLDDKVIVRQEEGPDGGT